jgi:hypothetical protein
MLPRFRQWKSVLALFACLTLILLTFKTTHAGRDEMALFFDELVPYGEWVDYKQYGPVWYPTKNVDENWRPYLDGRWVPTSKGWVFETAEPWGWATYHFGNWLPTQEFGWVWVPGSTWYPSTTTWRTYKKEGKEAIGWAPAPPPNYEPEPAFRQAGGFSADTPVQDQLIPAMYVFAEGENFVQGMSQPYSQEYSYANSGVMVPPEQVQEMFPLTEAVNNFVSAALNPEAVANWGPPLDTVSEATGVTPMALMDNVSRTDITVIQNAWPPPVLLARRAYFVTLLPTAAYVVRPVVVTGGRWPHIYGPGKWRLPPGTVPPPPYHWPPKRGANIRPHPRFASAAFAPGHPPKFLALPPKAIGHGGIHRPGIPLAGPGSRGHIRPGGPSAAAISKGPIPVATDRRTQLAVERAKMEEQRQQMRRANLEGGHEGMPRGEPGHGPARVRPASEPTRTPMTKTPSVHHGSPATSTTGHAPQIRPSSASPPPTAEQLRQQRQAQEQARIQQLQQRQQASGVAPRGSIATPTGNARPPSIGQGIGSASHPASGGGIRPPKGYSGPTAGSPGSPTPGGFGIRSPKPGGGSGHGPMAGQPAMGGHQGGVMRGPQGSAAQARPPAPQAHAPRAPAPRAPAQKGGGGGKAPQQKQEKKQEKK